MSEREPRERLYWLIDEYKNGHLDTQGFCTEFERTYNLEVKKEQLLEGERYAFGRLFDKVVYYSPFSEERSRVPNYLGDDEIRAAVEEALVELHQGPKAAN
jgi:hypothetical protein